MRDGRLLRYHVVAVPIGLCWWPLLQIAPNLRAILGGPSVLEVGTTAQLVMFGITGLVVAAVFRKPIMAAGALTGVVLGGLLPFVAAEVFSLLLVAYHAMAGTSDTWHAVIWGPYQALLAFYVVVPLGIVSRLVMRRVAGGAAPGG